MNLQNVIKIALSDCMRPYVNYSQYAIQFNSWQHSTSLHEFIEMNLNFVEQLIYSGKIPTLSNNHEYQISNKYVKTMNTLIEGEIL